MAAPPMSRHRVRRIDLCLHNTAVITAQLACRIGDLFDIFKYSIDIEMTLRYEWLVQAKCVAIRFRPGSTASATLGLRGLTLQPE
jgi:hypothetical protein